MKKSSKIEEPKHKSIAAAEHFESSASIEPPAFASASKGEQEASQAPHADLTESQIEIHEQEEQTGIATINPNKLFNAVTHGHQLFREASILNGVSIHGSQAIGDAGCLQAPDVSAVILADLSSEFDTMENVTMANAVSRVLGRFLKKWSEGFFIPGVHWFPMFQYFPGPVAPAMPNMPTPLAATPSFYEFYITHKDNMIQEILNELPSDMDNDINRSTIDTFSDKTVDYFNNWLNTSYIMGQIGYGAVPGFNLPFSMGGPVVGQVIPKNGVLS